MSSRWVLRALGAWLLCVVLVGCDIGLRMPAPGASATATTEPTRPPGATATPESGAVPAGGTRAQVVNIVDGDTIDVVIEDEQYRVRYIGMDTPERGKTFYDEATEANATLVAGREVILVKDVSETDRYGRLLRYVYLPNGTFVNASLVRNGYAQATTFPPDVAHADEFAALEQQAREEGTGLWGSAPAQPTATAAPATGDGVVIVDVNKQAEYVDIRNTSGAEQGLDGWRLVSERGDQECALSGALGAGQTLRVWAMTSDAGQGGFNCGFGSNIWSNSESDPAVLYDDAGVVVDRYP